MRNKQAFIDDYNKVVKEEIKEVIDPVEDAAHTMNQTASSIFIVPAEFTTTGNDEAFNFELKSRAKTDDPNETILDYFYVGRGE